jgi:hypothetical protein
MVCGHWSEVWVAGNAFILAQISVGWKDRIAAGNQFEQRNHEYHANNHVNDPAELSRHGDLSNDPPEDCEDYQQDDERKQY